MNSPAGSFFDILRRHAASCPDAVASRSSRRVVSYRKFCSRIERATARLISEWHVERGDIVVYWGSGHQDALMLYIAVARCGARLLPMEHASAQRDAHALLAMYPPKALLHDDDVAFQPDDLVPRIVNLSSLIDTRCHHHPRVVEDDEQASLITLAYGDGHAAPGEESSLRQLCSLHAPVTSPPVFRAQRVLFDPAVLGSDVLPVLRRGGTIVFP
jgi:acyl-CoA synthetase (AMP-forming)/AMP-acid ligase II